MILIIEQYQADVDRGVVSVLAEDLELFADALREALTLDQAHTEALACALELGGLV